LSADGRFAKKTRWRTLRKGMDAAVLFKRMDAAVPAASGAGAGGRRRARRKATRSAWSRPSSFRRSLTTPSERPS
jgi:hypothetical protein